MKVFLIEFLKLLQLNVIICLALINGFVNIKIEIL